MKHAQLLKDHHKHGEVCYLGVSDLGQFLWVTGVSRNDLLKALETVVYSWLI